MAVTPEDEPMTEEVEAGWLAVDDGPEPGLLPPDPLGPDPFRDDLDAIWGDRFFDSLSDDAGQHDVDQTHGRLPADLLADLEPGAFLAAVLEDVDAAEVDEYYLVELIAGFHRLAAWAQGRMTELTGRLARRPALNPQVSLPGSQYSIDVTAEEIAPRLGLSRFGAQRIVDNARAFRLKLEETGAALKAGQIDYPKACTIVRLLKDQPDDVAWEVQQLVLPDASHQTVTQLERAINKAIIAIDPNRATARHRRARDSRRVDHPRALADGMASMFAVLPASDAAGLDLALEAAARTAKTSGDRRTIDQLRADALALLGHGALEQGFIGIEAPERGGAASGGQDPDPRPDGAQIPDSTTRGAGPTTLPNPAPHPMTPSNQAPVPMTPLNRAPDPMPPPNQAPVSMTPPDQAVTPSNPTTAPDLTVGAPPSPALDTTSSKPTAQATDETPVLDPGGSFLRTPRMPIGGIGGRRAQIQVTVPLSVLIPPELLDPDRQPIGDSCARGELPGDDSAHHEKPEGNLARGEPPGDSCSAHHETPEGDPARDELPGDSSALPEDDDLPEDWYPGPVPAEVAELVGYGPITPDVARALAFSGGTWQRLVTDPLSGQLLDVGRTRYRPPAGIADFVRHRDGTCVRPACSTPARSCQLDHIKAWQFGGITSVEALACMCPRDHLTKTTGAFQIRHLGGGTFEWATPSGHVYRRDHTGRVTTQRRTNAAFAQAAPPF